MFQEWMPDADDDKRLGAQLIKTIDTNTRIDWFDSPEEFADALVALPASIHQTREGAKKAVESMRKGDIVLAERAQRLMEKVEMSGLLSVGYAGQCLDVAGHMPCIPAAINGIPENMFRRDIKPDSSTPMRVVVDSGLCAGLESDAPLEKGVMLLAFVLGLSARRPVEFYMTTSNGSYPYHRNSLGMRAPAVRMPTAPMDMAALAWFLCRSDFERSMTYHWTAQSTMVGWGYSVSSVDERYTRVVRRALKLDKHDIFFPGISIPVTDPVKWVADQLSEHLIEYQNAE